MSGTHYIIFSLISIVSEVGFFHTIDTANRVLVVIKAEICAEEYSPLDFASSNYFDYKFSCEGTTSFFTFKFIDDSTEPPGGVMSEHLFILLWFFY